ncbi:hypothetical protein [Halosegnis longus]|uniref:hypothetical protein n=1 Tax=Halosegnis longus TaxID=2216012 RepID=UPI00117BEC00|nr:hypothetical protein [Salella cibi]
MGGAEQSGLITEDMTEVYRRFVNGKISQSRAKDLLGENWEETAQVASIRYAQRANEESGYSADELSQILANQTGISPTVLLNFSAGGDCQQTC